MNRRSFLGASAGATLAGPDIAAKMVAEQGMIARASSLGGFAPAVHPVGEKAMRLMEPDEAIRRAVRLGIVSRETLESLLRESGMGEVGNPSISNLDPDLQAAKSFSMTTRIRMQRDRYRERQVNRFLSPPKNMWEFGRDLLAKGIIKDDTA